MRARSSGWLLLSLVVLSMLVIAELQLGVGKGTGRPSFAEDTTPAEPVPVPRFTLADRQSFTATLERPLFTPNRQRIEAEPATPTAPTTQAKRPTANRYALSAVIIVDDKRIALLTDTATGGLTRVREGERVAGWQVEKIGEASAVLRSGDTREELALRTFGPPPPRPQRQAPRKRKQAAGDTQGDAAAPEASPDRPRRRVRGPRVPQRVESDQGN